MQRMGTRDGERASPGHGRFSFLGLFCSGSRGLVPSRSGVTGFLLKCGSPCDQEMMLLQGSWGDSWGMVCEQESCLPFSQFLGPVPFRERAVPS